MHVFEPFDRPAPAMGHKIATESAGTSRACEQCLVQYLVLESM